MHAKDINDMKEWISCLCLDHQNPCSSCGKLYRNFLYWCHI